jgi:hypothetical protein
MSEEYHENGTNKQPNPEPDYEAQQAARDAVMAIPLFPDLAVALKHAIGYGPHVDMLQHFVYWFHPRHRTMQKRWTLYKTYKEWKDECGLTDRQVKKGRKVLRDLGLVTEHKGPRYRVHYRIDWVALADVLRLDAITDQPDDFGDDFDEFRLDAIADQRQVGRHGDQAKPDAITDQPNTGDYGSRLLSGNSLLHSGDEPAFAEPPPPHMNGKREEVRASRGALEDKRHSQNRHAPSKKQAVKERVEKPVAPPKPTNDTLLAEIRELLNPNSGRWLGAEPARQNPEFYTPEKVAEFMAKDPELPYEGAEELEPCVRYVLWEAA